MKHLFVALLLLGLSPAALATYLDIDSFIKELGGWEDKAMSKAKYAWSGSNFRTYKPVMTRTPEGGVFVTAQIHQVSAVASDVAVLEMTFDRSGDLISAQVKIRMGRRTYDTQLVKPEPALPAPPGEGAPPAPLAPPVSEVIATELFKKLDAEVAKWNETLTSQKTRKDLIGRLTQSSRQNQNVRVNFSGVVRHNFNLIAANVRTGQPYPGK